MTVDVKLLPLPEMDIYTLGSGVGLRDVRHTPVGFSQKKMSEYARANVICALNAAKARAQQPAAVDEAAAKLALANDISRVFGNTTKAMTDHLWSLGYRKVATQDQEPKS